MKFDTVKYSRDSHSSQQFFRNWFCCPLRNFALENRDKSRFSIICLLTMPFRYLNCMSNQDSSSETKSRSHTLSTLSTLKGLTKSGAKLRKHAKKRLDIEVQHTPPDAKLLAKYQQSQLLDLSTSEFTDIGTVSIEQPGRVCLEVSRGINTKGKIKPVPTPRRFATPPSSSSVLKDDVAEEADSESDYIPCASSMFLQISKSPTFAPKHSKTMSLPRRPPLTSCPTSPPSSIPQVFNPDLASRFQSQTLTRSFPKSPPPDHPPGETEEPTDSQTSLLNPSFDLMISPLFAPSGAFQSSFLRPQQKTCRDIDSQQKTCRDIDFQTRRNESAVSRDRTAFITLDSSFLLMPQSLSQCEFIKVELLFVNYFVFTFLYFLFTFCYCCCF